MKVRWTRPFTENLESACQYITTEDPQAAIGVLKRILGTLDTLSNFPEAGKTCKYKAGTRQAVVPNTPFIIVYRIRNSTIELLALFHQAQKWRV